MGPKQEPTISFQKKPPSSWVSLSGISKMGKAAIVISEDWAFFEHHGIDWEQLKNAAKVNLKKHRYVRGGSTITQQVVKNVFLSRQKTLWRKVKEILWATAVERIAGKKKILETYFNIAEWGEGIYGIHSASYRYFQTSPANLTAKEGAFLAMLLPSPKKYSASYRLKKLTPYAQKTVDRILHKMAIAGFLDFESAKALSYDPLSFETIPDREEGIEEVQDDESN